jgi:polyhydroxyalkanoate synthesis regulator protein
MTAKANPVVVKRYGDRRLYDVAQARYVTTDDLLAWRAMSRRFIVLDARTEEDITASVLAQTRFH